MEYKQEKVSIIRQNMIFKHLGLQVLEKDVKSFYEDILHFKILRTFILSEKEANDIFKISQNVKILYGNCEGVELELFINNDFIKPTFAHIGICTKNAQKIAEEANKKGYRVFTRIKENSETYFISDANSNVFEIKSK